MAYVDACALERTRALLDPDRCPHIAESPSGYLDVVGDALPPVHSIGQRLMRTTVYSTLYQAARPLGYRLLGGPEASGRDEDRREMAAWLRLAPGHTVLDICCGPGNFTGWFGQQVGPAGLAVGVDTSRSMLRRAASDNRGANVSYLLGDAERLPFSDGVADAVTCLAALYLVNEPFQVIAELSRILKPGGRLVILTSVTREGLPQAIRTEAIQIVSGIKFFTHTEITDSLHGFGFTDIHRTISGLAQTVTATKL